MKSCASPSPTSKVNKSLFRVMFLWADVNWKQLFEASCSWSWQRSCARGQLSNQALARCPIQGRIWKWVQSGLFCETGFVLGNHKQHKDVLALELTNLKSYLSHGPVTCYYSSEKWKKDPLTPLNLYGLLLWEKLKKTELTVLGPFNSYPAGEFLTISLQTPTVLPVASCLRYHFEEGHLVFSQKREREATAAPELPRPLGDSSCLFSQQSFSQEVLEHQAFGDTSGLDWEREKKMGGTSFHPRHLCTVSIYLY